MAIFVYLVTKILPLYNFVIFAMAGQPEKRHDVCAQQEEVVSDWLNPFSLGTMSVPAYIENVA